MDETMKIKNKIIFLSFCLLIIYLGIFKHFSYYRVFNDSMHPALKKGEYIVAVKLNKYKKGDIVVFKRDNKILVKRIIAETGESVDIDKDGNVFINGDFKRESYANKKSLEPYNIKLPHKITKNEFFVMGDNRAESYDSRINEIKDIKIQEILGKVVFNIEGIL